MNLYDLGLGKIYLNQHIRRLVHNEAAFHIHYWDTISGHYDTFLHKHSFFEIYYIIDGEGEYVEDDCTYPVQKDTIVLSRPDVLHQIRSEEGLSLLYVAFELVESESSKEWIHIMQEARQTSKVVTHATDDLAILQLWIFILTQATRPEQPFYEKVLISLVYSFLLSLIQIFVPALNNAAYSTEFLEMKSPILNEAKLYIQENLSQPLKLTDAANHLHISGRHLSRVFTSELGISYSEFVQNERIKKAITLLKTTNLSLKDIAEETGFKTVHYFTRVFTSIVGSSPGRFRSLYMIPEMVVFLERSHPREAFSAK